MSYINDILFVADIIGRDKPDIRRMVQHARLRPENAHRILKHMLLLLKRKGYDLSDLPLFNLNFR